jgi:hypothetical protein
LWNIGTVSRNSNVWVSASLTKMQMEIHCILKGVY